MAKLYELSLLADGNDIIRNMKYEASQSIDMICQHSSDGTIIPIKMRMEDDDGAYQEYSVKAYKDLRYKANAFEKPDVSKVHTSGIYPFQIRVESFGRERIINIYYSAYEHRWFMKRG